MDLISVGQGREEKPVPAAPFHPTFDTTLPLAVALDVRDCRFSLYCLRECKGHEAAPPTRLYDALGQPHFRQILSRGEVRAGAVTMDAECQGVQWYLASLPGSFYLAHIANDHTTPGFMRFLRLRLQALVGPDFDAKSFVFGDLGTRSTGMAGAGYDGVNGRATVGRPTSSGAGVKEDPTFADELYSDSTAQGVTVSLYRPGGRMT